MGNVRLFLLWMCPFLGFPVGGAPAVLLVGPIEDVRRGGLRARGAWHLPSPETATTRRFVEIVSKGAGGPAKAQRAAKVLLRVLGLFNPAVRETIEILYELEEPFVVDHSALARRSGRRCAGTVQIEAYGRRLRTRAYSTSMQDADPRLSRLVLIHAVLGAGLNLTSSARTVGFRHTAAFFVLSVGLPAIGEVLATGPLRLLRHRTRPRIAGVPVAVLLGWYCAIHGSLSLAEDALDALPLDEPARQSLLPLGAALVGTSLDLVLDPAGLDAGLWEWSGDGAYAREVEGANGRRGVPLINYAGWLLLVAGVVFAHGLLFGERRTAGRLPAVLLLPYYLAAVVWAAKSRRFRYLIPSIPFPVAFAVSLREPDR